MGKIAKHDEIQYHCGLSTAMVERAEYVLLPGDPYRVESLAKVFDPNAKHLASSREHISYLANFHGHKVLVCSTGLGAPSTGIAVEELANIGLKYFLRVGTCGAIQADIKLGDVVISTGAVRLEGTSKDYAPIEYPAVASLEFTNSLVKAAQENGIPHHVGITASTDTFWPAQERYDNHSGYILRRFHNSMTEWRALGVKNFEMEAAALFVMCSTFNLHAACICGVIAVRAESEAVSIDTKKGTAKNNWEQAALMSIYQSMVDRGLIKK
jgi:uridine phosphorylase